MKTAVVNTPLAALVAATLLNAGGARCQAPAPQGDADKTYSLVAHFTAGDVLRYRFAMDGTMSLKAPDGGSSPIPGPQQIKMDMTLRIKTAGVKPDGTGVLAVRTENGSIDVMGHSAPAPATTDMIMEVSPRGVSSIRNLPDLPGAQIMSQMLDMKNVPSLGVALPDHPVKVGDTWESNGASMAGGRMKTVSTLLGTEQVGGVETLKIKQVTTLPMTFRFGADMRPTTDSSQAVMTMAGNSVTSGIYNVLPGNARVVRTVGDIATTVSVTLSGAAARQSPFGDHMDMSMDGKLTMDLTSTSRVQPVPVLK